MSSGEAAMLSRIRLAIPKTAAGTRTDSSNGAGDILARRNRNDASRHANTAPSTAYMDADMCV